MNSNVNLGINSLSQFEVNPPIKQSKKYDINLCSDVRLIPDGFTVWDKIYYDNETITVKDFIDVL